MEILNQFLAVLTRIAVAAEAIASGGTQPAAAAAAAPAPAPPPAETAAPVSAADLNTAMLAKAGEMGDNGNAIFAMLAADYNGAQNLTAIPPENYAEVLGKVNALGA